MANRPLSIPGADLDPTSRELEILRQRCAELERALRKSEKWQARTLENLKEEFLFYRHDAEGQFTYVSPSIINLLGYTVDEYLGKHYEECWTENPLNERGDLCTKLSIEGIKQPPYEIEVYHKDGSPRRFIVIETPIKDEQGRVIAVEGTTRDITEKRKVEQRLAEYREHLEELVEERTGQLRAYQKRLLDIIEFLPDPTFVVDQAKEVQAWNRAMETFSGIKKKQVLGNSVYDYILPIYAEKPPLLIDRVLSGRSQSDPVGEPGEPRNNTLFEERFIPGLHGGQGGYVSLSAAPILDNDQQVVGAIESARDITQAKEAERLIRESERRLYTLMSNLPGMAYRLVWDGSWIIEFVSEGCAQLSGFDPGFFMGQPASHLKHLVHPEDLKILLTQQDSVDYSKASLELQYRIVTKDNEVKWVFDKAVAVFGEDGGITALEGFMADYTLFKKMEDKLRKENLLLRSSMQDRKRFENIVGNCQAMQDVYELILKAGDSDDHVIIYGESGTGKELAALAIHNSSKRRNRRFVAVNCAAIPENLIESEFFGSSRGAFTGASSNKIGYLAAADGGTLFLDEIGEISPNMQAKLLRAIDGGGFTPVGSQRVFKPDLRIVAASNKRLADLVTRGAMRQDFYYRVNVFPIQLPPLRERGNDLFLLIDHFLTQFTDQDSLTTLSPEDLQTLREYHWPGNVRELQNVLKRYVTMRGLDFFRQQSAARQAPAMDVPAGIQPRELRSAVREVEKDLILRTLNKNRWSRTATSRELGVSRKTLFRKIKELGLE